MATQRLSEKVIATLPTGLHWDAELPGFGLRVGASGVRTFIAQVRLGGRGAKQRRVSIGRWGTWTLETARCEARQVLATADRGHDPTAERRRRDRDQLTVADLVGRYLDAKRPELRSSSLAVKAGVLRKHVVSARGTRRASGLDRAAVERLVKRLAEDQAGAAREVAKHLRALFQWARDAGLVEGNPAERTWRPREARRGRFLSEVELARLGEVLAQPEWHASGVGIVRALILTGARRDEIRSLRWGQVDLDRGIIHLPATKTGARDVVLGAAAQTFFREVCTSAGERPAEAPVFPGADQSRPFVGIENFWQRVRRAAGLEGVRLHDLRHSHASVGVGLGLSLPLIGKLLGHAKAASTERYAHLSRDPVRAAADRVTAVLAEALASRTNASDAAPPTKLRG
jgi:integrase